MSDIQKHIEATEENMSKAIIHLENELLKIRAGKASPHILQGINIDYYGNKTPLAQVANVGVLDTKTIAIHPWDKNALEAIEKAILQANIGITPLNNGEMIRLNFPPLTEERRKELVKQVKALGETTKISVRNIRRDSNEELKKIQKNGTAEDLVKDAEGKVQKATDKYISKVDEALVAKEKEIMTV